jgi:uncharacterized cupredoxin-like copper-binding protein
MRWGTTLGAAAIAIASSGACAHGEAASGHGAAHETTTFGQPGSPAQATRSVDISMSDSMRFAPARFTFREGETVRFVVHNRGVVDHELVIGNERALLEHAKAMRDSPDMDHVDANMVRVKPGAQGEITWTFDRPGHFGIACLVPGHYEAGMKGLVVVR